MLPLIVVPWRAGDPDREHAWAFLKPYYEGLGWPLVECDSGDEPFNRANSQNQGAATRDWEEIMVLDADCWVPLDIIRAGIKLAHQTGGLVLPHDRYIPLNAALSEAVYSTGVVPTDVTFRRGDPARAGTYAHSPEGSARGGLHILSHNAWKVIGGYDPIRHRAQDTRMLDAAMAKGIQIDRLEGPLVHFFHRRPDVPSEHERMIKSVGELLGHDPIVGSLEWVRATRVLNRMQRDQLKRVK